MGQRRINTKPESNTCQFVYAEDSEGGLVRVPLAQINYISAEDAKKVQMFETAIGEIKEDLNNFAALGLYVDDNGDICQKED